MIPKSQQAVAAFPTAEVCHFRNPSEHSQFHNLMLKPKLPSFFLPTPIFKVQHWWKCLSSAHRSFDFKITRRFLVVIWFFSKWKEVLMKSAELSTTFAISVQKNVAETQCKATQAVTSPIRTENSHLSLFIPKYWSWCLMIIYPVDNCYMDYTQMIMEGHVNGN